MPDWKFNLQHRPYIVLKWAESADGWIDINRSSGSPVVLSSPLSTMLVHKKRAESAAILVGRKTALLDNPSLNVRHWYGKNPTRVVIDRQLSLPSDLHLFDGSIPTLVFTERVKENTHNVTYLPIDFSGNPLPMQLEELYRRKLQTLLAEASCCSRSLTADCGTKLMWKNAQPACTRESEPLR